MLLWACAISLAMCTLKWEVVRGEVLEGVSISG